MEIKNSTSNIYKLFTTIKLIGLPKISLNKWYAGEHWSKRNKIKDQYHWLIKSQFKDVLSKSNKYQCEYVFQFRIQPLDASNCVAMIKLVEDIIFEDDKFDIITNISISSIKGLEDLLTINIYKND